MSREISLTTPIDLNNTETLTQLRYGDRVLISGVIYTARDAAHKKMIETLEKGEQLPFDSKGAVIYYVGPTPPPPGMVSGSAGPTTSSRMDAYTPQLLDLGVKGVIGKGYRSEAVRQSLIANQAVYFAATGGAGVLLSKRIKESKVVAWPELGAEAVRRMVVENFPVTVAIDTNGDDIYIKGPEAWKMAMAEKGNG